MKLPKLTEKLMVVAGIAMLHVNSFAQQGFRLDDIRGTSGAGTRDLRDLTVRGQETAQSFADLAIIGFALVGLVLFGVSLFALYKAGKEDRESPKAGIWGAVIGGALTAVTVLLGLTRNTFGI